MARYEHRVGRAEGYEKVAELMHREREANTLLLGRQVHIPRPPDNLTSNVIESLRADSFDVVYLPSSEVIPDPGVFDPDPDVFERNVDQWALSRPGTYFFDKIDLAHLDRLRQNNASVKQMHDAMDSMCINSSYMHASLARHVQHGTIKDARPRGTWAAVATGDIGLNGSLPLTRFLFAPNRQQKDEIPGHAEARHLCRVTTQKLYGAGYEQTPVIVVPSIYEWQIMARRGVIQPTSEEWTMSQEGAVLHPGRAPDFLHYYMCAANVVGETTVVTRPGREPGEHTLLRPMIVFPQA